MTNRPPAPLEAVPVGADGSGPYAVTTGPDGALWVTLIHAGQIARVSLDGTVRVHPLDSPTCQPAQLTVGPDKALWFTRSGDAIGRITTRPRASRSTLDRPECTPGWKNMASGSTLRSQ